MGRAGYSPLVLGFEGRRNFAFSSRYAKRRALVPDPAEDLRACREALSHIEADLIVPASEEAALALGDDPRSVGAFPPLFDKLLVAEEARKFGLKTPKTWEGPPGDWPAVLKPRRSVWIQGNKLVRAGVSRPKNFEEARRLWRPGFISQSLVEGEAWGLSVLLWDGELLGVFAHRRLREVPPEGGPAAAAESIPAPVNVLKNLLKFYESVGFQGLAMAEFKGGYLLEINARPWGTLGLALLAGVDFPRLLVDAALGLKPRPQLGYRLGLKARWLKGDLARLRLKPSSLGEFLRGPWRLFNGRLDDPGPAIREVLRF